MSKRKKIERSRKNRTSLSQTGPGPEDVFCLPPVVYFSDTAGRQEGASSAAGPGASRKENSPGSTGPGPGPPGEETDTSRRYSWQIALAGGLVLLLLSTFIALSGMREDKKEPAVSPGSVAYVSGLAGGAGDITQENYDRAFENALDALKASGAPVSPIAKETRAREDAMNVLLDQAWLMAESMERGITVYPSEVTARYREIVKRLGGRPALKRYLDRNSYTVPEFFNQIQMRLLGEKIRSQVEYESGGKPGAMDEFVRSYEKKWKERTACLAEYQVGRCGKTVE